MDFEFDYHIYYFANFVYSVIFILTFKVWPYLIWNKTFTYT